MADEEIREEEPEVEGHGRLRDRRDTADQAERQKRVHDDDNSDDVEAHSFTLKPKADMKDKPKA
jgi:hypothetical protein